jgi:hypothetical protein
MVSSESEARIDQVLRRLAGDLERWGALFLEVARTRDLPTVEQVLGGLVGWMGNDLIDGWLYVPIPVFEALNERAEELFQACRAYLGQLRSGPVPLREEECRTLEAAIGAVLERVRAFVALGVGHEHSEKSDG